MVRQSYATSGGGFLTSAAEKLFQGVAPGADNERPIAPEQLLWIAVIARAWGDAFWVSDTWLRNSDRREDPTLVRQEARRWFTVDLDPWASDRTTTCDLAGIDAGLLQSVAREKLELVKQAESEQRSADIIALDRAFAALLEDSGTMAPAALDQALEVLAALEAKAA